MYVECCVWCGGGTHQAAGQALSWQHGCSVPGRALLTGCPSWNAMPPGPIPNFISLPGRRRSLRQGAAGVRRRDSHIGSMHTHAHAYAAPLLDHNSAAALAACIQPAAPRRMPPAPRQHNVAARRSTAQHWRRPARPGPSSPQLLHEALRHAAQHHGCVVVGGHRAVHAELQHHLLLRQRHACRRRLQSYKDYQVNVLLEKRHLTPPPPTAAGSPAAPRVGGSPGPPRFQPHARASKRGAPDTPPNNPTHLPHRCQ